MQRKLFVLLLTGFVICQFGYVNAGLCDRDREDKVGDDFLYLECGRGKRENNLPTGLKVPGSPESESSAPSSPTSGSPTPGSPKPGSPKPALHKSLSSKHGAEASTSAKGKGKGTLVSKMVQEVENRMKTNENPLLVPAPVNPPSMKMKLDRPKPKHFDVPRVPDSDGRIK